MKAVTIYEVGPRDGLQNEADFVPTDKKCKLINLLSAAGITKIEAASFVSPKWVLQMADAEAVMSGITRKPAVTYAALTPNLRGYLTAKASNVDEVAIFAAASEGFSQKNINCSIEESLERFVPVLETAMEDGIPVRGYVSCVVACPYDGRVSPRSVADVTQTLLEMGCYEVSLGDTIGAARPETTMEMLDAVLEVANPDSLAGHFHDTGGHALDNVCVALARGISTFDTAAGGLGGCPYAPGAKGNVATGEVVRMLHDRGYHTGVDVSLLEEAENFAKELVRTTHG